MQKNFKLPKRKKVFCPNCQTEYNVRETQKIKCCGLVLNKQKEEQTENGYLS